MSQLRDASTSVKTAAVDLKKATGKLTQGHGPVSTLLTDTVVSKDLKISLRNIREGSERLNQNMEAMKHNFLFRGYFKKLEKQNKKDSINAIKNKK